MAGGVGVVVNVHARRIARPDVIFRDWVWKVHSLGFLRWGREIVELGVVDDGRHGSGNVAPGRYSGYARREVNGDLSPVEADAGGNATQSHQRLQQDERQISPC